MYPSFGLLRTIHYFIIFCKIAKTSTAYAESSFFGRTDSDSAPLVLLLKRPFIRHYSRTSCTALIFHMTRLARACSAYMHGAKNDRNGRHLAIACMGLQQAEIKIDVMYLNTVGRWSASPKPSTGHRGPLRGSGPRRWRP